MKRKNLAIGLSLILGTGAASTIVGQAGNNNKVDFKICIDAGQYIDQPGKRSPDGYQEVQYTLAVAKQLKKELEKKGVDVIESNADGTNKGLGSRGRYALKEKADYFISLHMDSAGKEDWQDVNGFHFITQSDAPEKVKNDIRTMANLYHEKTGKRKHLGDGVEDQRGNISALEQISPAYPEDYNVVPATLLEMDFMDNKEKAMEMRDPKYQKKLAKNIADILYEEIICDPYYQTDQIWEKENTKSTDSKKVESVKEVKPIEEIKIEVKPVEKVKIEESKKENKIKETKEEIKEDKNEEEVKIEFKEEEKQEENLVKIKDDEFYDALDKDLNEAYTLLEENFRTLNKMIQEVKLD